MRLAILGCGLLGASIAVAARGFAAASHTVGFDLAGATLDEARRSGAFDAVVPVAADGELTSAERFDLGVVAVPPAHLASGVRRLAPLCDVLLDVGSVKAGLLKQLGADLPAHFVPCHPMAGSENRGAGAADPELFRGRSVLITPGPQTAPTAVARVTDFWRALGASTHEMAALEHDAAVAYTSHLPHLLAFAYMGLADVPAATAGPGFRDFSRLAAANPALWSDILRSNKTAWQPLLEAYIDRLRDLETLLLAEDASLSTAYLTASAARRRSLDGPHDASDVAEGGP